MENGKYVNWLLSELNRYMSVSFGMTIFGEEEELIRQMQGRAEEETPNAESEPEPKPLFETILMKLAGVTSPGCQCNATPDEKNDQFIFTVTGISPTEVDALNQYFNITKPNTDPTQFNVDGKFLYRERFQKFLDETNRLCNEAPQEIAPCLATDALCTNITLFVLQVHSGIEDTVSEREMFNTIHQFAEIANSPENYDSVKTWGQAMLAALTPQMSKIQDIISKAELRYDVADEIEHVKTMLKLLDAKVNPKLALQTQVNPTKGFGVFDTDKPSPSVVANDQPIPQSSWRPGNSGCME